MFKKKLYTIDDDVVVTRNDDPQGTSWKAKIKNSFITIWMKKLLCTLLLIITSYNKVGIEY